jgi:hypothetical protein
MTNGIELYCVRRASPIGNPPPRSIQIRASRSSFRLCKAGRPAMLVLIFGSCSWHLTVAATGLRSLLSQVSVLASSVFRPLAVSCHARLASRRVGGWLPASDVKGLPARPSAKRFALVSSASAWQRSSPHSCWQRKVAHCRAAHQHQQRSRRRQASSVRRGHPLRLHCPDRLSQVQWSKGVTPPFRTLGALTL